MRLMKLRTHAPSHLLEHFTEKMGKFDRAGFDGIILDEINLRKRLSPEELTSRRHACRAARDRGKAEDEAQSAAVREAVMVEEQIFWLHVSVHNSELVQVLNSRDDLLVKFAGFFL